MILPVALGTVAVTSSEYFIFWFDSMDCNNGLNVDVEIDIDIDIVICVHLRSFSFNSVVVTLPPWAVEESSNLFHKSYDTDDEKMALAIHLSARNINERTGGPFGTAIFYKNTLVAIGMNRVVPLSNSTLHGEVVAIQMAQKKCQTFSLQNVEVLHDDNQMEDEKKEDGGAVYELFTSCEPCAMCLGATLWSGVGRLVCAATKDDAMKIGFDEGPVFEQSYKYLEDRGIEVVRNVMRDEAAAVLKRYGEIGVIYNR